MSLAGSEIGWSRGGPRRGRPETKTGDIPASLASFTQSSASPPSAPSGPINPTTICAPLRSACAAWSAAPSVTAICCSGIEVGVAAAQRHAIGTIVRLELDGPAAGIAAIHPA